MKRLSSRVAAAPVLLVVIVALVLSSCSSTSGPPAATVNGTDIGRRDLQNDLQALSGNPALAAELKQQGLSTGQNGDTVSSQLTAGWLTTLVSQVLINDGVEQRHLEITAADRASAHKEVLASQGFGPKSKFEKFPQWFQDQVIQQQAETDALRASLKKQQKITEAVIQRFYDQNKAQLCPSGKLVSHILVQTQAEADAIEAQLKAGASYDQLAATSSIDSTSGKFGGRLTCIDSQDWSQLDQTFRTGAESVPVGTVSAPIQTQFGFHIIRVTDFSYPNARPLVAQLLEQQVDPLSGYLTRQLKRADITIDPRYGRITRGKQGFSITPPAGPKPRTQPASPSSSTTTTPAGAQSGTSSSSSGTGTTPGG